MKTMKKTNGTLEEIISRMRRRQLVEIGTACGCICPSDAKSDELMATGRYRHATRAEVMRGARELAEENRERAKQTAVGAKMPPGLFKGIPLGLRPCAKVWRPMRRAFTESLTAGALNETWSRKMLEEAEAALAKGEPGEAIGYAATSILYAEETGATAKRCATFAQETMQAAKETGDELDRIAADDAASWARNARQQAAEARSAIPQCRAIIRQAQRTENARSQTAMATPSARKRAKSDSRTKARRSKGKAGKVGAA